MPYSRESEKRKEKQTPKHAGYSFCFLPLALRPGLYLLLLFFSFFFAFFHLGSENKLHQEVRCIYSTNLRNVIILCSESETHGSRLTFYAYDTPHTSR